MHEGYIDKINSKWLMLIILALGVLFFLPVFQFGFLSNYDDEALVLSNMVIRDLSWNGIQYMFSNFVYGLYHPLVTLSFAVDYYLFGLNPTGYHITNVVLHSINGVLIFSFLYRLFPHLKNTAFIASLLFIVQPLNVEPVSWISGRKDLLYVLFYLMGLLLYLNFTTNKKTIHYLLTFLMFVLSLFSKPAAVSFPLALLVINYIQGKSIFSWKEIFRLLPFFFLSLLFGYINIRAQQSDNFIRDISDTYNVWNRITLVLFSFYYYMISTVLPLFLCPKHFYPEVNNGFLPIYMYLVVILMTGTLIALYAKKFMNKLVKGGLLFYFVTILFMLKFIPTGNDYVSDRYAYLAIVGLLIPLFSFKLNGKLLLIGLFVLSAFSVVSFSYMTVWKSSISVWTKVINVYPKDYLAYNERGQAYLNENDFHRAIENLDYSNKLNPNKLSFMNLGLAYAQTGNYEKAVKYYHNAQILDSSDILPYIYSGKALANLNFLDSAIFQLKKAVQIEPLNTQANNDLGITYAMKGESTQAIEQFQTVIKTDPYFKDAYFNLIKLEFQLKNYNVALNDIETALEKFKNDKELLILKANTFDYLLRIDEEIEVYKYLIKIDETNKNKYLFIISNLYARKQNFSESLNILFQLFKEQPKNPNVINNIGNCYFSINRIDSACIFWNKAFEMGNKNSGINIEKYCK